MSFTVRLVVNVLLLVETHAANQAAAAFVARRGRQEARCLSKVLVLAVLLLLSGSDTQPLSVHLRTETLNTRCTNSPTHHKRVRLLAAGSRTKKIVRVGGPTDRFGIQQALE